MISAMLATRNLSRAALALLRKQQPICNEAQGYYQRNMPLRLLLSGGRCYSQEKELKEFV